MCFGKKVTQYKNYFGLPSKYTFYDYSKFVVVPIPYEKTVNFGKGAAKGPIAILQALSQIELFDFENEDDTCKFGIHILQPLVIKSCSASKAIALIAKRISQICADGKVPIVIGGEHTVSVPSALSVLAQRKGSVICLDAHADLWNTFKGSKFNHACVNRRLAENYHVTIIGCRNISKGEWGFARKMGISIYSANEANTRSHHIKKALQQISCPVYLSVDVDVLDPSLMPATGAPEPGGLRWEVFIDLIRWVCINKKVVGADVVELAPIPGIRYPEITAATLLYRLIKFISKKL